MEAKFKIHDTVMFGSEVWRVTGYEKSPEGLWEVVFLSEAGRERSVYCSQLETWV